MKRLSNDENPPSLCLAKNEWRVRVSVAVAHSKQLSRPIQHSAREKLWMIPYFESWLALVCCDPLTSCTAFEVDWCPVRGNLRLNWFYALLANSNRHPGSDEIRQWYYCSKSIHCYDTPLENRNHRHWSTHRIIFESSKFTSIRSRWCGQHWKARHEVDNIFICCDCRFIICRSTWFCFRSFFLLGKQVRILGQNCLCHRLSGESTIDEYDLEG